jgi:hypothetical protein
MKQKIIRLLTDDPNARFDNYFNDDLIIKKNSKVALLNARCELTNLDFVIDQTNNKFGFMLDVDNQVEPVNVYLETDEYNDLNITDFFDDWAQKHNSKVNYLVDAGFIFNDTIRGFEFSYTFQNDPTSKIKFNTFDFGYGRTNDALKDFNTEFTTNIGCDLDPTQTKLILNNIISGMYIFNNPLAKGGGGFKFTLPDDQDIIVGLVREQDMSELKNNGINDITKIKYGYKYLNNEIRIINDGILSNFTYGPLAESDEIMIMYIENIMVVTYLDEDVYLPVGNGLAYNHEDYLFGVIYINPNTEIDITNNNCQVYSSWDYNGAKNDYNENNKDNDSDIWNTKKTWTKKRLYFPNKDVLQQLGFEQFQKNNDEFVLEVMTDKTPTEQPSGNYIYVFQADERINVINPSSSYIVELQNISTDFNDALSEGRKNYIMTFPNQEPANLTNITYNAVYPIFIDIKLVSDQPMRVIRARILLEDGSEIETTGNSIITLLIQEE